MITSVATQNVERSGEFRETEFKIKANAKAFKILSDGLYSDKIGAILRELSCNAYDAHIAIGNTNPFVVHMPNNLEPHFSIRDFGTGLSHEDIFTIFTTYFESTKTTSNEFVGCLGLGSKSPYSYTDSFTVTSYLNGVKRTYNSFLNENGVPSIALLAENKTDEPNGLEIQFPVKQQDFNEFKRKAPAIYQYFKIQPKIEGVEIDLAKPKYFLDKNTWGVREYNNNGLYNYHCYAIMGNVAYPLDDFPTDNLTSLEKCVLGLNIDINFNIGDLEVSASREKLSYDTQTRKNIRNRLVLVAKEIISEIETKVKSCPSLWEARKMVHSLSRGEYSAFHELLNKTNVDIMWNGKKVTLQRGGEIINLDEIEVNGTVVKSNTIFEMSRFTVESWRRTRPAKCEDITHIPVSEHTIFFYKDESKNIIPRCLKHYQELVDSGVSSSKINILIIKDITTDGVKKFKEVVGLPDTFVIPNISTLTYDKQLAVNGGYAPNPKNYTNILKFNGQRCQRSSRGRRDASSCWDGAVVDINNVKGVYVSIDRYKVNGEDAYYYVNKYLEVLTTIDVKDTVIYGIKWKELENVKKAGWQTLEDYTKEKLNEYFSQTKILETYIFNREMRSYEDNLRSEWNNVFPLIQKNGTKVFGNRPEIIEYQKTIKKSSTDTKLFEKIADIDRTIADNLIQDNDTIKQKVAKLYQDIMNIWDNYPVLAMLRSTGRTWYTFGDDEIKTITDYVKMYDKMQKVENSIDKN